MANLGLVLVHGRSHAGDCWDPTVAELARQSPELQVLAVDLPGRRSAPGDLATLTIKACVDGVVAQIEAAGMDRVVIVGLGADRVARMVLVSCCIPPEGKTVIDTLAGPLRYIARRRARTGGISKPMSTRTANYFFCNGMSPDQRDVTLSHLYPDVDGAR